MFHWSVEVDGRTAEVRGKELKNGMFAAFKNHFADIPADKEFTIKVTPVVKEKPEKKEEKAAE